MAFGQGGRRLRPWASAIAALMVTGASALAAGLTVRAVAAGSSPGTYAAAPGVEHLHFRYGPLPVIAGQNLILIGPDLQKPQGDGWIVGMRASLTLADGTTPPVTQLHLHHGVWINLSRQDATSPGVPERFFASGEEKTYEQLPVGYGYRYRQSDAWALNYMLHNLTPTTQNVYITYDIDFIPDGSPLASGIEPVRPIWMDVRNGEAYPVFDALRANARNGVDIYPDYHPGAYGTGKRLNEWTVDRAGTLVGVWGHLHPGGLFDDLDLVRGGATTATAPPGLLACHRSRATRRSGRHVRNAGHCIRRTRVATPIPGAVPRSVRIFRSEAMSYDPRGRVSWDMSMTASPPGWRVAVKPGDVLRIRAAYDTSKADWYESMGIMVAWMADGDTSGADPFTTPVPASGDVTHGPLPENAPGGGVNTGLPDPAALPAAFAPLGTVAITNFAYQPGDMLTGSGGGVPTVRQGQSLNFINDDAALGIYHTITACRQPCSASYGASYPIADGAQAFDSGQLGIGPPGATAAAQRFTWSTPTNLPPGTYTFFCRIHPWMRGAFRVITG
jgi:hypothetical protein